MSVSSVGELDLLIQKATSESIPNGELDLPSAMEISDVVRSRRIPPKESMRCLKKRIMSTTSNPNTQLSAWKLTDICVKNGGIPFIKEICSREFMDTMEQTILKNRQNSELEELVTKLFCELYVTFKNDSQLNYVSRVYEKLVARGVEFPQSILEMANPMAMFDSRIPADWVDSDACMICSKKFSLINRRHHCRSCGGIFCQEHSSHRIVLADLGIHDPVRVCDNCFEDYDLKKSSGGGSGGGKKKHRSKRKKKASSDDFDEEEQLRKAIELSLRETRGTTEPIVPVMQKAEPKATATVAEEEDDPDLKAAIEASLKEAEEERRKKEAYLSTQQQQMAKSRQPSTPSYELTSNEEEDIHLFASLVERMKTLSAAEILEDAQLPKLYHKVIATRPKLNNALNDSIQKYNTLIDMNTKISEIMTIYDALLERQLNNISLSDRYSMPQVPSDPYSYAQNDPSSYQSNAPEPYQGYSAQQSVPQQEAHTRQSYPSEQTVNQQQMYTGQVHRSNTVYSQPQPQAQPQPQPQSLSPTHLDQMKEINISPATNETALNAPSEPPYPLAEEEELRSDDHRSSNREATATESPRRRGSGTERKLSNGTPYPVDDVESENGAQTENASQPKLPITNFDFPTVPASKIAQPAGAVEENSPEASQSQEKLLIEL